MYFYIIFLSNNLVHGAVCRNREPRAVAGLGVFAHLLVTGRVAERRVRPAANHAVYALGLARKVVVEQKLGFLGQERLALLVVPIRSAPGGADHLLGRDPVHSLGIDARCHVWTFLAPKYEAMMNADIV